MGQKRQASYPPLQPLPPWGAGLNEETAHKAVFFFGAQVFVLCAGSSHTIPITRHAVSGLSTPWRRVRMPYRQPIQFETQGMMKLLRRAMVWLLLVAALAVVLVVGYGMAERSHHRQHPVSQAQVRDAHERAVQWLLDHQGAILDDGNSALWLMIQQTAAVTGDARLQALFERYLALWFPPDVSRGGWRRLFMPQSTEAIDLDALAQSHRYQHFLMYAVTCEPSLAAWPAVKDHLSAGGACPVPLAWALKDSTCSSHQLMGLNMLKARGCATGGDLQAVTDQTRADVRQLLWFDFRIRDVYIQRALTLWWGGYRQDVPDDVVTRIIRAQLPDGGWNDQHVLWQSNEAYLAMGGPHALTMSRAPADFHVTAQALLLSALVLRDGWGANKIAPP